MLTYADGCWQVEHGSDRALILLDEICSGTHFTCFTSTKVQILTHLRSCRHGPGAGLRARAGVSICTFVLVKLVSICTFVPVTQGSALALLCIHAVCVSYSDTHAACIQHVHAVCVSSVPLYMLYVCPHYHCTCSMCVLCTTMHAVYVSPVLLCMLYVCPHYYYTCCICVSSVPLHMCPQCHCICCICVVSSSTFA